MIGTYIDQYLITAKLGGGSLGDTVLAEAPQSGEPAALKLIEPQLLQRPGFAQKLQQLIAAAQNVQADHVLPVTYEVSDGRSYLKMPYFRDGSLAAYLQKLRAQEKWVSPETAVALVYQIAARLRDPNTNFAEGFRVHGALHPRNILLSLQPLDGERVRATAVLTDFGQASLLRENFAAADVRAGGSHPWLHPSVLQGEVAVDERADLYALGHLLYLLLHGEQLPTKPVAEIANAARELDLSEVDARFIVLEQVATAAAKREETVSFIDRASYIALTAVRIYERGSGKKNVWLRWLYALEQMIADNFVITPRERARPETASEDDETRASRPVDMIWRGFAERPPVLGAEALSSLTYLPPVMPAVAATTAQSTAAERPSPAAAYIDIIPPQESTAAPQRFPISQGQGLITVGADPFQDITLVNDDRILPHHLRIEQRGSQWQVQCSANHTRLDGRSLLPGAPETWPADAELTIGGYALRLRQPAAAAGEQPIGVTLLPSLVEIIPGYRKRIGVSIRNQGSERGYFKAACELLATPDQDIPNVHHWFTLPQDGVVLNPGEQQDLTLLIHPPIVTASQERPFAVVVQRIAHTAAEQVVYRQKGIVRIVGTADFAVNLQQQAGENDGRFLLIVRNDSNRTMTFQAITEDPTQSLLFAPVTEPQVDPISTQPAHTTPMTARTNADSRSQLSFEILGRRLRQTELGREIGSAAADLRRAQRHLQQGERIWRQSTPQTNLRVPPRPRNLLQYSEQFSEEVTVEPRAQGVFFLAVQPRQRPWRWQQPRQIPFSVTVTPKGSGEAEAVTKTADLHATARFSRAGWLLLTGLLLLACLLFSGWAAFQTVQAGSDFQATHVAAATVSVIDSDNDGLSNHDEATLYNTDPENPDTDGDTILDGVEVSLAHLGVCPTRIDCNGDGVPDAVAIQFPTPSATPQPQASYPTAQPTPQPTDLPTVTPTSMFAAPPPQAAATATAVLPFFANDESEVAVGDTRENEARAQTLIFNTYQLPPDAEIVEASLLLEMDNPADYDRLRTELGNLYATVGAPPSAQQLASLRTASPEARQNLSPIIPVANSRNLLLAQLDPAPVPVAGRVTITLFFELGSDFDGFSDRLVVWAPGMQGMQQRPSLYVTYRLAAEPEE